jgi:formylglycine-generating enzyme required for sulfatase activity
MNLCPLARACLLSLGSALGLGCAPPPRGQVLVYVDTDAPLPVPDTAELSMTDPAPLFDTLLLEVTAPRETAPCQACSREVAVDRQQFAAIEASFGVLPEEGRSGYVARARLFRDRTRFEGEPRADSSIDVTVRLPMVMAGEVEEVTIFLPTDSVGVRLGSVDEPLAPRGGRPERTRAGTWPGAARVPCTGVPLPHEACVPGGAFWMGNPGAILTQVAGDPAEQAADEQRLVILSPFFLDKTEVTVAAMRDWALIAGGVAPWSGSDSGTSWEDWCTYTLVPTADAAREAMPVNCVTWAAARGYCNHHGASLPSEAQLEYVASGLAGLDFAWGHELPACEDAVYGRGGTGILSHVPEACHGDATQGGPAPVGSGARDRVRVLDGVEIVDPCGNVIEYTGDAFQSQDGPCWPTGVVRDPRCDDGGDALVRHTTKGGWWFGTAGQLKAALRAPWAGGFTQGDPAVGFRCARPDAP